MKRLTRRGNIITSKDITSLLEPSNDNQFGMIDAYYKLKEYEDLEENGMIIKLPYPLETEKLYWVDDYERML